MKKLAIILGVVVVAAGAWLFIPEADRIYPVASFPDGITIAPLEEALTFARIHDGEGYRLIGVEAYAEGAITGVDLTEVLENAPEDPITLFNASGYDELAADIGKLAGEHLKTYALSELAIPVDLTDEHVAAGTNYAAHADESSVEDGPFLFAKMVEPTPHNAPVSVEDGGLLDYEVELAYVTLSDTKLDNLPEYMGIVATNDFTNRAKLLRALNPDDVTSGDGFTTGKSAPGFLPVGTLFVIPKDYRAFSMVQEMRLAVNGELRQKAPVSLMIWDIDELFNQIAARENIQWDYLDGKVGLPIQDGTLPARTMILAGTPDGTVFQGPTTKTMVRGVVRFVMGGWGQSVVDNVIENYIDSKLKRGTFLQPGDEVHIQIDGVGEIRTTVE